MLRKKLICGLLIIIAIILLPYFITIALSSHNREKDHLDEEYHQIAASNYTIHYKDEEGKEQSMDLEEYIIGVVAAEMPASFELEALKAQAVAARTYAIRNIKEEKNEIDEIYQVYITKEEMEEKWGVNNFLGYYNKIEDAVMQTQGKVIVYENEPIVAVFHSTSAGKTRGSEDIWNVDLPYLTPVDSSDDIKSPTYLNIKEFTPHEFVNLIANSTEDFQLHTENVFEAIQIISRNEAGYILSIQIGNKILEGEEVRNILGLNSSHFTIEAYNDNIRFITKGYGHGVGLSQYGANYMAIEGYTYEEILTHYYENVEIVMLEEIE
ncbi:stage II sporulation protein D [Natranaerovirga hydrolytica]|uniref:Stage II sporulation protein D n=1 Tax=Natranaerovirga hydrolytica TaxID=680378 RepID=A0A4R1MS13_9FIRM|nr:stage II sporulation protein D [Natranaerovirga hydrolytica]TCK93359.1 stage II sporulation protein D [Natranaerovirga hydrolytica]